MAPTSSDDMVPNFPEDTGEAGVPVLPYLNQLLFPKMAAYFDTKTVSETCGNMSANLFQCLRASLHVSRVCGGFDKERSALNDQLKTANARVASSSTKLDTSLCRVNGLENKIHEEASSHADYKAAG
ncbi:hypothetical protein vseg_015902 [Gypsophila vaccaria]